MGSHSSQSSNHIRGQYALVQQAQIYHFGNISIYQDTQNHQFFTQNYSFVIDPNASQQFITHLQRKNNNCPNLMQIKHITNNPNANYCTNSTQITVTFQYFNLTLQKLIDRNYLFNENQGIQSIILCIVIRIFYCLLMAVKYLNDNQSYHGDICPSFVYVDVNVKSGSGQHIYKIFDSSYFQPNCNGYFRAQKQKTYCAPQILTNLAQKKVYPLYNHHIADTFSIGLVTLYCMSMIDPLGAYNRKHEIDFYYIESMLRIAQRKGYSEKLVYLVRLCLQHKNRPSVGEILEKFMEFQLKENLNSVSSKMSLRRSKYNGNTSLYQNSR